MGILWLTRLKDIGDDKIEGDASETIATDTIAAPVAAEGATEVHPLKDITNQNKADNDAKNSKISVKPQRERRERGPPADGIPSKTKVMVANLPYDLTEEKVRLNSEASPFPLALPLAAVRRITDARCSLLSCSRHTSLLRPRLHFAPSLAS